MNQYLTQADRLRIYLLALLMFSATALWRVETASLYLVITLVCSGITFLISFRNLSKYLYQIKENSFFLWITFFFVVISVDWIMRKTVGVFNYDFTLFTWASIVVVLLLLVSIKNNNKLLHIFSKSCELAAIFICFYIFINERELLLAKEVIRIGTGLSGNVNTIGIHLGFYSLGILYLYISTRKKRHLLIYFLVAVFMLLTGSKKTLFYLISAISLYFFYGAPRQAIKRLIIIGTVATISIYFILANEYFYEIIGSRTIDFLGSLGFKVGYYNNSNSTIERIYLINIAWHRFLHSPLIGNGYYSTIALPPYYTYAHSNYFEILADYGLIGFIYFYTFYYKTIRRLVGKSKKDKQTIFVLILVISCLFRDIAAVSFADGWIGYLSLIIASVFIMHNRKENRDLVYWAL